jgi:8-oxo-dGTP pyrophosphatase MutT (NUDIX family)
LHKQYLNESDSSIEDLFKKHSEKTGGTSIDIINSIMEETGREFDDIAEECVNAGLCKASDLSESVPSDSSIRFALDNKSVFGSRYGKQIDDVAEKLLPMITKNYEVVESKLETSRPLHDARYMKVVVRDDKYGNYESGLGKFVKILTGVIASDVQVNGNLKTYWFNLEANLNESKKTGRKRLNESEQKDVLGSLSQQLQDKLKDFKVTKVFIENGEVNVVSEYEIDGSYVTAIEKELNINESRNSKKAILFRLFESKKLSGFNRLWSLHESLDAPIQTYADMVVRNTDGKVLLLQRNSECSFEPNKWGFAGGKVQVGEVTKLGAIRECKEECGIDVDLESVEKIGEFANGDGSMSHYYKGTATNDVILGNEHQNFLWCDPSDVINYDLIMDNKDRYNFLVNGVDKTNLSEASLSNILSSLAKGDLVEISGLLTSPKKYAKASMARILTDKLNKSGIIGDKTNAIVDKLLKFYPTVSTGFNFLTSLIEGKSLNESSAYADDINKIEEQIKLVKQQEKSEKREKELAELKKQADELRIKGEEEELQKVQIKIDAINKEIQLEKNQEKLDALKNRAIELENRKKKLQGNIESIKKSLADAIDTAEELFTDPNINNIFK